MKKYFQMAVLVVFCLLFSACSSSKSEWNEFKFKNIPIKQIVPYANTDEIKVGADEIRAGLKFILAKPVICSDLYEVKEIFFNVSPLGLGAGPWMRKCVTVMANPNVKYEFKELVFESNGKYHNLVYIQSSIDKL